MNAARLAYWQHRKAICFSVSGVIFFLAFLNSTLAHILSKKETRKKYPRLLIANLKLFYLFIFFIFFYRARNSFTVPSKQTSLYPPLLKS